MDLRLARRSPINILMTTRRSALDWGDPDAITIFNPGNRGRYRDLLWAHPTRSPCSIQVTRRANMISYGNADGSLLALPLLFLRRGWPARHLCRRSSL